jgi:hypothetical protein
LAVTALVLLGVIASVAGMADPSLSWPTDVGSIAIVAMMFGSLLGRPAPFRRIPYSSAVLRVRGIAVDVASRILIMATMAFLVVQFLGLPDWQPKQHTDWLHLFHSYFVLLIGAHEFAIEWVLWRLKTKRP